MAYSAHTLVEAYASKLKSLEHTRRKIERLFAANIIVRRDVEQVYEALFLSSITAFEALLEDLFFGLMMGRFKSGITGVRCKINVASETVAREVALAEHEYLDWLPYSRTTERAKVYFASGLPFTVLDDGDKSFLKQSLYVRNAIAHKSKYAMDLYKDKVVGTMVLPPRERGPASFLRSQFRTSPAQCRYEDFAGRMLLITRKLCQ